MTEHIRIAVPVKVIAVTEIRVVPSSGPQKDDVLADFVRHNSTGKAAPPIIVYRLDITIGNAANFCIIRMNGGRVRGQRPCGSG